jgi:tryptophanyl-tRNA synthetase
MKRIVSGVQPTAEAPHLGNYLGAFKQWVGLQDTHESLFPVVDLHAMTLPWDPGVLRASTRQAAAILLACGVDPDRSVIFVQSEVGEHTELGWLLTCLARMGELGRMTQFKEKSRGVAPGSVGAGLFMYPVLMAADVLAYRGHLVPVGDDQRQHLELMRELAGRFNRHFGETFPLPETYLPTKGARIMSLQDVGDKMSKSATSQASVIWMTDGPDEIREKISKAVTDSGSEVRSAPDKPAITNLLETMAAVREREVADIEAEFVGKKYSDFKAALSEAVIELLAPIQKKLADIEADPSGLDALLDSGREKAAGIASETLTMVREKVGLRVR